MNACIQNGIHYAMVRQAFYRYDKLYHKLWLINYESLFIEKSFESCKAMKQLFVRITKGRLNVFVMMDTRVIYSGSKENFDFAKISIVISQKILKNENFEWNEFLKGEDWCLNINECDFAQLNHCYSDGTCTDTEGSYTCGCPAGFVGDGRDCENIDECENGSHDCDPENGICLGRFSYWNSTSQDSAILWASNWNLG